MRVDLFDFDLPEERIALRPAAPRDSARLLAVRPDGEPRLEDRCVRDLPDLLRPGDVLVFNDTKVIPARLHGLRARGEATARVEVLLHKREGAERWRAFARPAKRLAVGDRIRFGEPAESTACELVRLDAEVEEKGESGEVVLRFSFAGAFLDEAIERFGEMPLPPYIAGRRAPTSATAPITRRSTPATRARSRRRPPGCISPTTLLRRVDERGIGRVFVTLHVGPGTFLPVKAEDTAGHRMHAEFGTVSSGDRRGAQRSAGAGRAHRRGRHHRAAAPRERRRRGRHDRAVCRRDRHLHHAGLPLPGRRRADDELPPAALDAVHAGLRVLGPRRHEGGLCPRDRGGVSVLFVRRCVLAVSR